MLKLLPLDTYVESPVRTKGCATGLGLSFLFARLHMAVFPKKAPTLRGAREVSEAAELTPVSPRLLSWT